MIVKLKTSLKIKDQIVNEVSLNFDNITGNDLVAAESEVRAIGDQTPSVFLSMRFQAAVAAKLIGVPVDDVLALPVPDFRKLVLPVANFLLG
nr:MAG TPA: tail assembly chaperone protein [Caudoviricetes sp.]